ncbi:hypothetical protein THRCLA_11260 [Thraustotheca clavata]|uniref:Uncharacterized protein n=1 Tax=Thraustotheca clavata TaxID=74557 RepID=A0A1V9Y8D8_9STRA|nr:hypothetical protein THRCLA_11260 [Thraustotheca clavata]
MASNPISNWINGLMPSRERTAQDELNLLQAAAKNGNARINEEAVWHRSSVAHQAGRFTSPEGYPNVPRQYVKPSHSADRDYATYPANSLSAFIAITDILADRDI